MQNQFKIFKKISLQLIKCLSGVSIAYVIALIGKEFINYGTFSFVFIMISITMAFLYVMKGQGFITVFIINCLLVAVIFLLRSYVLWAYGL